ncbi:multicomponent Na+:H+ antiporter subunit C [Arcanobacterium wilhelmae]|uniref:Multicomponent Na+:H+ antiporter subunit C n=1 Tax=Arcanobacterium wilhelmae TaxID=1803177 RepID=A0ABT9NB53_9ACTO|nr:Na(+)/H(+) antiporter subunit C [Arcanobacterium wilhelmae]MDP9800730.1 multicomponent Na+:H+ antiporter subunit C [Arcanobacterium wilhelmae]WFN90129.1 Na(+)/H(+) antiporter subunit C [Arcanobacterium wilhelmae]
MSVSVALIFLAAVLVGVGVYLVLERSLTRIILGLTSITNGVNILFLIAGGRSGKPPLVGAAPASEMADPLVQAMMLTAIVISLGAAGFLLALAYRSWQLTGNDEVQDDPEDRRVARITERAKMAARADADATVEEDAAETHDETEGDPDADGELGVPGDPEATCLDEDGSGSAESVPGEGADLALAESGQHTGEDGREPGAGVGTNSPTEGGAR